jgi:hypothetical protein
MRTIIEGIKYIIHQHKLPINLWEDLLETVIIINNTLPYHTLPKAMSPYEAITGNKFDTSFFVDIGSKCYVKVYDEEIFHQKQNNKLKYNAQPAIVVGYHLPCKGSYKVITLNKHNNFERKLVRYDVVVNNNLNYKSPMIKGEDEYDLNDDITKEKPFTNNQLKSLNINKNINNEIDNEIDNNIDNNINDKNYDESSIDSDINSDTNSENSNDDEIIIRKSNRIKLHIQLLLYKSQNHLMIKSQNLLRELRYMFLMLQ